MAGWNELPINRNFSSDERKLSIIGSNGWDIPPVYFPWQGSSCPWENTNPNEVYWFRSMWGITLAPSPNQKLPGDYRGEVPMPISLWGYYKTLLLWVIMVITALM